MPLFKLLYLHLWHRRSGLGVVLCGLYAAASAWLVFEALHTQDVKGANLLLSLPILPAMAAADTALAVLGAQALLHGLPWPWAYLLFLPPTLALVYGLGWLLTRLGRALKA